jgi:hypothetical protein
LTADAPPPAPLPAASVIPKGYGNQGSGDAAKNGTSACSDICKIALKETLSITSPGQPWNSIDDQLCGGLSITNDSCTVGLKAAAATLATQVNIDNLTGCALYQRIYERCQVHTNPSQVQQQCAVYQAINMDSTVKNDEIGLLTAESIAVAACGVACGMWLAQKAGLAIDPITFTVADAACTAASITDAITELTLAIQLGENSAISGYLNGASVLGMDPTTFAGLQMGAAAATGVSLGSKYLAAEANKAASAGTAASDASKQAARTTNTLDKAAAQAQKASRAAAKTASEAAAKSGSTLGAKISKTAGEKLAKIGSYAEVLPCLDLAMETAILAMRGSAYSKIMKAGDDACNNIKALSTGGANSLNLAPGAPTVAAAGTASAGAANIGSAGASSESTPQTTLSQFMSCAQAGNPPGDCASQSGVSLAPDSSAALANAFGNSDFADKFNNGLTNLDNLVNAASKGGAAAAMAAATPSGLPDDYAAALTGFQQVLAQEAPNLSALNALNPSTKYGASGGSTSNSDKKSDPFAAMLLSFGKKDTNNDGANKNTQVLTFKSPVQSPTPSIDSSDIWHTGYNGTVFDIVSNRVSKKTNSVDPLEWFLPLNRAVHGLKNAPLTAPPSTLPLIKP